MLTSLKAGVMMSGNKQGFLEATVEFALRRNDLREDFLQYLIKIVEKEINSQISSSSENESHAHDEVAVSE